MLGQDDLRFMLAGDDGDLNRLISLANMIFNAGVFEPV